MGAGAVLLAIAANVRELHGIDLDADPAPVEAWLGSHQRSATLIRGSVYELPYETAEFDLALSFSVFEHLHQYARGLREVARVLKPGGRFLLGMPAVNTMMQFGFRAIGCKDINDHHVATPRAVASAFDGAGLRIIRHDRLRLIPGVPLYFNWLLRESRLMRSSPDAPFPQQNRLAARMKMTAARDRYGLGALGVYLALSMLFFGRGLAEHFTTRHVGKAVGDPAVVAWFLAWMPHAIAHRANPFYTNLLWAPATFNLAWTTWMPLVGLLLAPITRALGPVYSLNVVLLTALPLTSWSAFVLYRHVTGSWWASFVGGYLFGFSGYMLYFLWKGDPLLLLVFPVILGLWLVLRAIDDEMEPWIFAGALATMLVAEFLISLEFSRPPRCSAGSPLEWPSRFSRATRAGACAP